MWHTINIARCSWLDHVLSRSYMNCRRILACSASAAKAGERRSCLLVSAWVHLPVKNRADVLDLDKKMVLRSRRRSPLSSWPWTGWQCPCLCTCLQKQLRDRWETRKTSRWRKIDSELSGARRQRTGARWCDVAQGLVQRSVCRWWRGSRPRRTELGEIAIVCGNGGGQG
jgi:hypothetical protein